MRKNMLWISFIALLILSVLGGLSVNTIKVSAGEYPAIMVIPETILEETLTPSKNFTISIYTDYNGSDIWGYQFTLSYNPNILHGGINKTDTWNGDGVTNSFNTTRKPVVPESELVYVNETLMTKPENYTIDCIKGSITLTLRATDTWNGDGVTTVFNTTRKPVVPESELVYVNETLLMKFWDYMIDYDTGEITFWTAPGLGAQIKAIYMYPPGLGAEIKAIYLYGVYNGDLIVGSGATFVPGGIDNAAGTLEPTSGFFFYIPPSPPGTTTGPGTLANVTFTVVGYGASDITIGDETILKGYNATTETFYEIINADYEPDHIQHGFFSNVPLRHDVAMVSLVAPDTAAVEQLVPINVTVANEGTYDEDVTLTVYNETTVIDTTTFLLEKGLSNTFSFSWDTSGLTPDPYTINATATIAPVLDDDLSDNNKTKTVTLLLLHDVAVVSLVAPDTVAVEQPVPINVTVANEGSYSEYVTLTVYNQTAVETTVIDSTSFTLAKGSTSNTVSFSWNTSGVAPGMYKINATATIAPVLDNDLSDNNKTRRISLIEVHDVAVVNVTAPLRGNVNDNVLINVTVKNTGSYTETFSVTTYYDDTAIVLPDGKNYTTVTLVPAESTTTLFTWDTTGVAPSLYTIKAWASNVTGETNTADNTLVDDTVLVTILGDVDVPPDGAVGTSDLIALSEAYGSHPQMPNWNPYCDFNRDDKVDASDLFDLSKNYGNTA